MSSYCCFRIRIEYYDCDGGSFHRMIVLWLSDEDHQRVWTCDCQIRTGLSKYQLSKYNLRWHMLRWVTNTNRSNLIRKEALVNIFTIHVGCWLVVGGKCK